MTEHAPIPSHPRAATITPAHLQRAVHAIQGARMAAVAAEAGLDADDATAAGGVHLLNFAQASDDLSMQMAARGYVFGLLVGVFAARYADEEAFDR